MDIRDLLNDASITIEAIASKLDALDHDGRMAAMANTSKKDQKRLWELAANSAPMTYEDFVPASVAPMTGVTHHGRNTLPVFNSFAKVFAKRTEGGEIFGYNEGSTRPLIGPGYFITHDTKGTPAWEERGAWVVDYFEVPEGPVCEGWPTVKKNSQGLQFLVYHQTRDFMRKVSNHVSIGMAFKVEKSLNNWFTLVRED